MNEIIFLVEDAPEGGYSARAVGESIFTQAASAEELHAPVRDAVRCHFDEGAAPNSFACISDSRPAAPARYAASLPGHRQELHAHRRRHRSDVAGGRELAGVGVDAEGHDRVAVLVDPDQELARPCPPA